MQSRLLLFSYVLSMTSFKYFCSFSDVLVPGKFTLVRNRKSSLRIKLSRLWLSYVFPCPDYGQLQ